MNNPRKEFYSTFYLLTLVNFMKSPLVSVIIPTYKRRNKLKRAIKSVLNQTYPCIEIIVVNDDPSTNIEEVVNIPEEAIVINHKVNKGGGASRNTGIFNSSGKYIAFLDDDDVYLPEKIERQVDILKDISDDWIGVYSWGISYTPNGNKIVNKCYKEGDVTLDILTMNRELKMGTPSLLLRTELVKKIGGFDESLYLHEDWDLLLRLLEYGKIKLLPIPLWIRYVHDTPHPDKLLEAKNKYLKKYQKKMNQFSKKERRLIYQNHHFSLCYLYLVEGNMFKGLYHLKKSLKNVPPIPHMNWLLRVILGFIEGTLGIRVKKKML